MLQVKRHSLIFEYVVEKGCARVNELSQIFGVSPETIRRDLTSLAKNKKIVRSFGGAMISENNASFLDVDNPTNNGNFVDKAEAFIKRTKEQPERKMRIAKSALQYIHEHECIIMDNSSSCWFLARQLPDIELTVITNSLNIIQTLACRKKIRIVSVGGEYSERHGDFHGPVAEFIINNFKVNKLFFSCQGLDSGLEIKDSNEVNVRLKQEMLKVADQKILMVDSSKFERYSLYKICDLADIDVLITNKLPKDIYRQECLEIVETS